MAPPLLPPLRRCTASRASMNDDTSETWSSISDGRPSLGAQGCASDT
eukprot:COSAG06_NODE_20118_length_807_cov_1.382768_2_plen_46_part_01